MGSSVPEKVGGLNCSHNSETLANKAHLAEELDTSLCDTCLIGWIHPCPTSACNKDWYFPRYICINSKGSHKPCSRGRADPGQSRYQRHLHTADRAWSWFLLSTSFPWAAAFCLSVSFFLPPLVTNSMRKSSYERLHLPYVCLMPCSTRTWFFRGMYYPICTINAEITYLKNKQILPGQQTVLGPVGQSETDTVGTNMKLRNKNQHNTWNEESQFITFNSLFGLNILKKHLQDR